MLMMTPRPITTSPQTNARRGSLRNMRETVRGGRERPPGAAHVFDVPEEVWLLRDPSRPQGGLDACKDQFVQAISQAGSRAWQGRDITEETATAIRDGDDVRGRAEWQSR